MNARRLLPLATMLSLSLAAQVPEDASLGIQARISKPESDLKDMSSSKVPGLGVSLVAETGFPEGYRARLDIGYDLWQKGDWSGRPGIEGHVSAYHVSIEGIMMLRPEESPAWGPYVLAGIGGYAWSVGEDDASAGTSTSTRSTHAAFTLGMGWRLAKTLDAEVKLLTGRISAGRNAAAIQAGVTYRFNP
jgi:hypothetical protein